MSSLGSANSTNYQYAVLDEIRSLESNVVDLWGSFIVGAASNPVATSWRGSWFSVIYGGATGVWTVTINLNIGRSLVASNTLGSPVAGQPAGLIGEPVAWVVNDASTPTIPTAVTAVCSRYNNATLPGTFNIYTLASNGSASNGGTSDRVTFRLSYKNTGYNP